MNALIVLTAVLACASAQYLGYAGYGHAGYGYAAAPAYAAAPYVAPYAAPAHVPTYASQYHSQDEYGQASYGYAQPGAAKSEVRDAYGNVAGSYYYINPEGKRVEVSYTAGADGFKVHSNDLPVAPTVGDVELPVAPVYNGVAPVAPVYTGVAPEPVQDTPEVAAAKAAHAEALAAAEAAAAEEPAGDRKKRSVPHGFPYSVPAGYPYGHHGYAAYPYALGYAHHGYARLGYLHH